MPDQVREAMRDLFERMDSAVMYGKSPETKNNDMNNNTIPDFLGKPENTITNMEELDGMMYLTPDGGFGMLKYRPLERIYTTNSSGNWELCPKCAGEGHVFPTAMSTNTSPVPCRICKGCGIISTLNGLPPYDKAKAEQENRP